jgi:hypothetical protein
MKRSTKVTLALMGAVGIGGTAYALSPGCPPPSPGAAATDQACRSSHSGYGHSGWNFFSGAPGGTTTAAPSPSTAPGAPTSRGGFGGSGRASGSAGS